MAGPVLKTRTIQHNPNLWSPYYVPDLLSLSCLCILALSTKHNVVLSGPTSVSLWVAIRLSGHSLGPAFLQDRCSCLSVASLLNLVRDIGKLKRS